MGPIEISRQREIRLFAAQMAAGSAVMVLVENASAEIVVELNDDAWDIEPINLIREQLAIE